MAAGWFDPLAQDVDQSDIIATNAEHSAAADALLVGRNTFEAFRDFWPKQTDDPTGVSDYLNSVNKYVVSRTIGDRAGRTPPSCAVTSSRSTSAEGRARSRHRRHRQRATRPGTRRHRPGRRVPIVRLPGVVGRGLFESGEVPLRLLETRPFISGAVLLRYSSLATPAASTAYEA